MKRSQLAEIIREIVGGYEPDGKGNLVRHSDRFDSTKLSAILKRIVNKDSKKEKYEGDPDKGNEVLNRADQKDIDAILNGTYKMQEGEGATNIFSKHPHIKDILNAMINTDGTVELQVYGTKGGLPIKQTAAIPLAQFTPEYVEKHTSQKYDIDDKFRQGIQQFVDSVQNANA